MCRPILPDPPLQTRFAAIELRRRPLVAEPVVVWRLKTLFDEPSLGRLEVSGVARVA